MTRDEVNAWAKRAGIAAAAMLTAPAMIQTIVRMVAIAFEVNPALQRDDITRAALTALAWEQLSAAAKSAAAQPQSKTP